jgi:hypothetical protein
VRVWRRSCIPYTVTNCAFAQVVEFPRGELINERFARARRHHGEGVLAVEETLDRFLLSRAEGCEVEMSLERGDDGMGVASNVGRL